MQIMAHGRIIQLRMHRSMERLRLEVSRPQRLRLENTLRTLPAHHVAGLTYLEVRQIGSNGGSTNTTENSDGSEQYWVVLHYDHFARRVNNTALDLNYTLLHEMGHVVDSTFSAFSWMQRHDRAGYDDICARVHRHREGGTDGDREKFADAYADYHFSTASGRRRWPRSIEAIERCTPIWTVPERRPTGGWGPTAYA